ncbi:unnamed protein product, partial [Mesorhabditis belari]|uniref:Major facilitator superfamily (MFS) profile domain-containing protein n=1 Tax=Mesorhabditis belari TaxID=2138241 RepID=A0AAF3F2V1_9BILA
MGECIDDFQRMGRYTVLICVLCELIVLLQAGNLMFMVFGGAPPTLIGCEDRNDTAWLHHHDLCELYQKQQCIPIIEYQFHSVNVEFTHLCSEGKRIKDSTSYQMIGYMVGAIVFGQVSDTFGRKWALLDSRQLFLANLLFVVLLFLAPTVAIYCFVFAALRWIIQAVQMTVEFIATFQQNIDHRIKGLFSK